MCVVAGASSGIGRACADHLEEHGWQVCGVSRTRPASWPDNRPYVETDLVKLLDESPQALRDRFAGVGALPANAAPGASIPHGEVDFAVVHAVGDIYEGVGGGGASWSRWRTSLDLCLGTAVLLTQATFDEVRATAGSFVYLSSVGAVKPYPGIADYCAAKAALQSYVLSVARELAPAGGRANCLSPAVVDTPLFHKGPYSADEAAQWHALGRIGEPSEVAAMVAHLIGEHGRWITGQNYVLDGGMAL
jgi:NAD(P)-dependent dehydrogenase (short-subunit alcohol dehydrogenase family)